LERVSIGIDTPDQSGEREPETTLPLHSVGCASDGGSMPESFLSHPTLHSGRARRAVQSLFEMIPRVIFFWFLSSKLVKKVTNCGEIIFFEEQGRGHLGV
jgi:hypothetical protein